MTEQRLRTLFDYQCFEKNNRLSDMLSDALGRYDFSEEGELSDDDVDLLNAAGSLVNDPKTETGKRI
jgi:hypothetical protein